MKQVNQEKIMHLNPLNTLMVRDVFALTSYMERKNGQLTKDEVQIEYDNLGRVKRQSRPYRVSVESPVWTEYEYDDLDRPTKTVAPDGTTVQRFYNETTAPSAATSIVGQTVRSRDAWGRERWGRFDEQNRLVEVVEPNPTGDGSVASGGMATQFQYDTLGNLKQVNQGEQVRKFRYDSLGRLTHQKLAERDATLNDNGDWVGNGTWSDRFFYDSRSNLIEHVEARGVTTHYAYENDPLNRLKRIQSEKSRVPTHLTYNIPDQFGVGYSNINTTYDYATTGDKMRVVGIRRDGENGNQIIQYDVESRVSQVTQTFIEREGYPLVTNYLWDTLDRVKEVRYPQKYGAGDERKIITHSYDVASRLTELKYGQTSMISSPVFNAANQITSLVVGDKIQEKYDFDPKTGLLIGQQVNKGSEKLLDLKYNYTLNNDSNNNGAKTGQLTSITDLKNEARNRAYSYDPLGRFTVAKGGANATGSSPDWWAVYSYDRYGNKTMPGAGSGSEVWVDDSLPEGATPLAESGDNWNWRGWGPEPKSGEFTHVSNIASGEHQHFFYNATQTLQVNTGDKLYTWVYLDPANTPSQIMLQWNVNGSWEHRAFWGLGTDQGNAARYMGPIPQSGAWVKLEVPASAVGLEGTMVNGMAFALLGGRAAWDKAGKIGADSIEDKGWSRDGIAGLNYNSTNNRVTANGFAYDPAGNQISAVVDGNGRQQKYKYDSANRLTVVQDANGAVRATYAYAGNQRIMSIEGGVATYHASEGGQVIAEYEAAGASGLQWKMNHVYLGGRLLATDQASGGIRYHHPDRLGTRLVTDAADGVVISENITLPFGTADPNSWQNPAKTALLSKKKFTSYDRSDSTGLDYAVNQHYSSAQGRFTQVDPIGMSAVSLGDPQTLNLCAYCANDPVNRIDPDGTSWFGKLFGFIGKAFKLLFKVIAVSMVVVAMIMIPAVGVLYTLGQVIGALAIGAVAGLAGWHNGKLGVIASAGLTDSGRWGKGNYKTPPFNGSQVGPVGSFLQEKDKLPVIRESMDVVAKPSWLSRVGRGLARGVKFLYRKAGGAFGLLGNMEDASETLYPIGNSDFSIERVFNAEDTWFMNGPDRVMTPEEFKSQIGGVPEGWAEGSLGKGTRAGLSIDDGGGWILREMNNGQTTGRFFQWHPGNSSRHGPDPYWKIVSGKTGKR